MKQSFFDVVRVSIARARDLRDTTN